MAMIEINGLFKQFGPYTAVDHISFHVDRGEVLGFLGPNGAGKSTTMKMITGFLAPDGGSVTIDGKDISRYPVDVKKRIGYLPEGAPSYPDMTTEAFLRFIAEVRGFRGKEIEQRVAATISKVQLEGVVYQAIDTLSKGFKRRVGLAQAILHDPEVLILDEPTDGLDPNQKQEVRNLISAMAQEKVIILSTHILEEVEAICSRAIIIAGGKLIADDTPAALEARSSLHNSVSLLLSGISLEEARHSLLAELPGMERIEGLDPASEKCVGFRIFPKNGKSLVSDISQLAQRRQWRIEELHIHRGRLDEVFRELTSNQQKRT